MSRFSAVVLLAATVAPRDTVLPHPNNEKYSHNVAIVYLYVIIIKMTNEMHYID